MTVPVRFRFGVLWYRILTKQGRLDATLTGVPLGQDRCVLDVAIYAYDFPRATPTKRAFVPVSLVFA